MSKPASSLADVQSLAARCIEMADPQLDADFEATFGQAPAVFAALPAQAQQAHLQSHAGAGDPATATMSPPWSNEHCEAAQSEGWDIFNTQGSDGGPWQIQRFDDASEYPYAAQLATDEQAREIVRLGKEPHHAAARLFIQAHNPKEWTAVSGNVESGIDHRVGQSGVCVRIKPVKTEWGNQFEVEVTTGYRAGKLLSHGGADTPLRWPDADEARAWLKDTGYTVIPGREVLSQEMVQEMTLPLHQPDAYLPHGGWSILPAAEGERGVRYARTIGGGETGLKRFAMVLSEKDGKWEPWADGVQFPLSDTKVDAANVLIQHWNNLSLTVKLSPQENAVESAPADLRVASDEVKLSLSTAEVDLIRHALETHRDLLASPTSADRDANGGDWADKQVHACDALLVALSAPTKAQTNYTGGEVARQQDDNHRRAALQKLQREKIGVADLVLATDSLNPQIKVAIGTFEGTSKGGNVQLRLLHVLRAWGNDGHHRPDAHLIQALYSGLGNYSDFKSDSVRKIAKADVPFLIGQSEHQLLERIQSAAVVPPTSDDSLSPGM